MTPDELRALADALLPMAAAPCFDGIDIERAAAYLRAQADAQPVAWRSKIEGKTKDYWIIQQSEWLAREQPAWEPLYTAPVAPHHAMLDSHRRLVEQAIQTAEHPSGMSTHDGKARIDASVLRRMLSIIDSLPAAPQAEPCIGNNPTCPCQDGDACHYRDAADGTKGWPVPQAEPKLTPASCDDLNVYKEMADNYRNDAQAEPKREPVGTLTIRDDMGAEITFHRSFTMRPRQTFAIYPNWDLLTHDIPTRGAFVVNAPKEIGNE